MLSIYFILIYLVTNSVSLSIETVRAQNVTKREANVGDPFPDWVPFKNKHGEELGEFVQVSKPKPKKRLAPPINFILRAVAEPEGDDYYDKGQGESDSEDNYESKDWSDLYRPAADAQNEAGNISHTEISDIDGVVDIITSRPNNPVVEALKRSKHISEPTRFEDDEDKKRNVKFVKDESASKEEVKPKVVLRPVIDKNSKYEDEIDYEDGNTDGNKKKSDVIEDDQSENEAKKTSILDSVDELKERHAEEQRSINEKIKEEEIYREERERDKIQAQLSNGEPDKYEPRRTSYSKKSPQLDYEEYDENPLDEKYVITPERTKPQTTTKSPLRTIKHKGKKEKQIESGKLSVFKNPQLYMIYDYDLEESTRAPTTSTTTSTTTTTTTSSPTTPKPRTPKQRKVKPKKEKYSSKYTSTPVNSEDRERISLVPQETDGKEGEPTLFFPMKRKNKKRKSKSTSKPTPEIDSTVAETISTKRAKLTTTTATEPDLTTTTAADTTAADSIVTDSTAESGPSAAESGPSAAELEPTTAESGSSAVDVGTANTDQLTTISDAVAASTDHKAEPKTDNYHTEKGVGKEYSASHEEEHSEEGKKAYEGVHKESKTSKGHHEKENHLGKYDDSAGVDKHHEEESGHYGAHHHEEHGKKHAKYEESGKHSKGHSTKGSHDIHKKEEYEKKVEFFEEEGDSGEEEKHGGYNNEHSHGKGGHYKKGNFEASHEEHAKGDSGHFAKGGHLHVSRGHKEAGGHDGHGKKGKALFEKAGRGSGKNWIFHHGYPAKTSNLVRIDRRADQYHHGPQYYG